METGSSANAPLGVEGNAGQHNAEGLRRTFRRLRGWTWLIILVTLIAGIGSYLGTSRLIRPTYTATATLEVDVAQLGPDLGGGSVAASQQFALTEVALVHTYPIARAAYRTLHLTPPVTPASLLASSTATTAAQSQLVQLSFSSHDPAFAAAAANAMARAAQLAEQAHQTARYRHALESIQQRIAAYQGAIRSLQSASGKSNVGQAQMIADQSALGSLQTQYAALQATEAESSTTLDVRVPAQAPTTPSSPRPGPDSLLAAFLALLAVSGLLLAYDYFGSLLVSPEEVSRALGGAAFLGAVPVLSHGGEASLSVIDRPRGSAVEAYRMVRTSLFYSPSGQNRQVVLVTSGHAGEGKSTTATNLAASIAELGKRVILVDADLRRPTVGKIFEVQGRLGLVSALVRDTGSPDNVISSTRLPSLWVLPAGIVPPNPTELLGSRAMDEVIQTLRREFDVVIIDSPPLLAVADTSVLARFADVVLVVADERRATRQNMGHVRDALSRVGVTAAGVVVNRMRVRGGSGYYSYGYDYEYAAAEVKNGRKSSERSDAAKVT